MKKFWKIFCWILLIILFIFTFVNGILLYKNLVYGDETPDFLGYISIIMESNNMEPKLKRWDLIIDQEINTEENVNIGDIISYKYGDKIITNRVAKISIKDNQKQYLMQDDYNEKDTAIITFSNMRGKYLTTIPYIGSIVKYLRTPTGFVISLFIITVPFIIVDIISRNKKIKKIDELEKECEKAIRNREKILRDKEKRRE